MSATRPSDGGASSSGRPWLVGLFVVYLVLLIWAVLWKLQVPFVGADVERHVKLIPFVAAAADGPSDPVEVAVNVMLFVPFGVYSCLLWRSWTTWRLIAAIAGWSGALEVLQYVLAVGRSDMTDVVANSAGGLVGLGLVGLARRGLRDRTTIVLLRACAGATALALVGTGVFVASPVRFGPRAPTDPLVCRTPRCDVDPPQVTCHCAAPRRAAAP